MNKIFDNKNILFKGFENKIKYITKISKYIHKFISDFAEYENKEGINHGIIYIIEMYNTNITIYCYYTKTNIVIYNQKIEAIK